MNSKIGSSQIPSALGQTITGALANIPFRFGIDSQGNYGYKKTGADTAIPFSSGVSGWTLIANTYSGTPGGVHPTYIGNNVGMISNSQWGTSYPWRVYQGATLTVGLPKNKTILLFMSMTISSGEYFNEPSGSCIKNSYYYLLGTGYQPCLYMLVETTNTNYSFSVYGYSPALDTAYAIAFELT